MVMSKTVRLAYCIRDWLPVVSSQDRYTLLMNKEAMLRDFWMWMWSCLVWNYSMQKCKGVNLC